MSTHEPGADETRAHATGAEVTGEPAGDTLRNVLQRRVDDGTVPGAVALVVPGRRSGTADGADGGETDAELAIAGTLALPSPPASDIADPPQPPAPMRRDTIFRIASLTKPIVAAALLSLVDEGLVALDDPITRWLPELEGVRVARSPASALDDTVALARPITVWDALTSRTGWGFPSDFELPVVRELFAIQQGALPAGVPAPAAWLAALARIPLLHQPGDGWLYNLSSDLQGLLIARITGRSLGDALAERVFAPLGMVDTGFVVPAEKRDRLASFYRVTDAGAPAAPAAPPRPTLELIDGPDGQWSTPPAFESGAGGLVSTVDDLWTFARMLLAEGVSASGRRIISADAVRLMMRDHLTPEQRESGTMFLDGQGWGCGGTVDVAAVDPWNVPGRYGWVGGTGTSLYVVPSTGAITIQLSQLELGGPTALLMLHDVWQYAAGR